MSSLFSRELLVVWVAMLPVIELRGAIPLGISLGLPPFEVFFLALLGNLLPLPVLLLVLEPLCRVIRSWPPVQRQMDSILQRSHRRGVRLRRWGLFGLAMFVSIPLPSTGVWSGALIASFLGFRLWPSALALTAGTVLAAILVTLLSVWGLFTTAG